MKSLRTFHASLFLIGAAVLTMGIQLKNPLGEGRDNPDQIIADLISAVLGLIAGIALIFFIYGGFMMLISGGSEERITKGKGTLLWASVGLIVVFGSYAIVRQVFELIS